MNKYFAVFALFAATLPIAHAQLVLTPVASNSSAFDDGSYNKSLSEVFTVNQAVSVTAVGYWDMFSDGVSTSTIKVGLFYASGPSIGTLVSGTEIDFTGTAGTLSGNAATLGAGGHPGDFRTSNLGSPVTLSPGTDYAIVAQGFDPEEYVNGNSSPVANFNTISGALTFDRSGYNTSAAGFMLPTENSISSASGPQWLAGTFSASAIPEPSTYAALFGAAVLGVAGFRRMRQRQPAA